MKQIYLITGVLFMAEKETVFSRKIRTYSKPTIQKISDLTISVQRLHQVVQIVEESETEEEVVEKLNSLSK